MNEQKFKAFLRMLDEDILPFLDISLGYLQVIHTDKDFYASLLNLGLSDDNYRQWLSEVKAERGLDK